MVIEIHTLPQNLFAWNEHHGSTFVWLVAVLLCSLDQVEADPVSFSVSFQKLVLQETLLL